MVRKTLFKILAYEEEKDVLSNGQLVGKEVVGAVLVSVFAFSEAEALTLARNKIKRNHYDMKEAIEPEEIVEINVKSPEPKLTPEKKHRDLVQLFSKGVIALERIASSLELQAKK